MLGLGGGISSPVITNMHNQGYLTFDGDDAYIQIDTITDTLATAFDNGSGANEVNFTISCWVKLLTMATTGSIFNLRVGTSTTDHIILMWHGSGNNMRFTCKFNGTAETAGDGGTGGSSGAAEGDGNWWHIVGRATHGGDCELWINGIKRDNQTIAQALQGTVTLANIGTNTQENAFFNGDIDEVAIWSRAITDTEISTIYNAGIIGARINSPGIDLTGPLGADLIGYYRFEEKAGTVAINDSGSNGTLVNTPIYNTY